MQLRPPIQIKSIIKSLSDVVLPAIDSDNKLAVEQGKLILSMLNIIEQSLPLEYRFDCDELGRLLELGRELSAELGKVDIDLHEFYSAVAGGQEVLERAQAEPAEVYDAVKDLRAKIGAVVEYVVSDNTSTSANATSVRKLVLDHAAEQLLRDRSWLVAQGWEAHSENIPSIESLIHPVVETRT